MADKPHEERTRAMLMARKRAAAEPAKAASEPITLPEPEKTDERGMRRQTLYLPPGVYEEIRETCHTKRISQQEFFRQVFDYYFEKKGMKRWADLERAMPAKKRARS